MTDAPVPPPSHRAATAGLGLPAARGDVPARPLSTPDAPRFQAGAFAFEEVTAMFEGQSTADVEALIKADPEFRQLYRHHQRLNNKVMDAELGVLPIDDITLAKMKKEKLAAKDRLTRIFARTRH